MTSISVLEAH